MSCGYIHVEIVKKCKISLPAQEQVSGQALQDRSSSGLNKL